MVFYQEQSSRCILDMWKSLWKDGQEIIIDGMLFIVEYIDLDYIYNESDDIIKIFENDTYYYIATCCYNIDEYYKLYCRRNAYGNLEFKKYELKKTIL